MIEASAAASVVALHGEVIVATADDEFLRSHAVELTFSIV